MIALSGYRVSAQSGGATNIYVDSSKGSSGNGSSWSAAFKTLSEALSTANYGSGKYNIHVAQGTYFPSYNGVKATSRDSVFVITRKGISIYGGYPSGGGIRNSKQYVTRLSGDIGTLNNISDNSHHVLAILIPSNTADSLVLDGLNIEYGNANGTGSVNYFGVSLLRNYGGGVYVNNTGSTVITNVYFKNCMIQRCEATVDGGGIQNYKSTLTLVGCFIYKNKIYGGYGAGLNNEAGGSLFLYNNCFVQNSGASFGGGLRVSGSSDNSLVNCTFVGNEASVGGGLRVASLGTATLRVKNCIFRSNKSGTDSLSNNADLSNGSILFVDTSCVQSNVTCTGCLTANTNPLMVNLNDPL